jgi:hypothetical protein
MANAETPPSPDLPPLPPPLSLPTFPFFSQQKLRPPLHRWSSRLSGWTLSNKNLVLFNIAAVYDQQKVYYWKTVLWFVLDRCRTEFPGLHWFLNSGILSVISWALMVMMMWRATGSSSTIVLLPLVDVSVHYLRFLWISLISGYPWIFDHFSFFMVLAHNLTQYCGDFLSVHTLFVHFPTKFPGISLRLNFPEESYLCSPPPSLLTQMFTQILLFMCSILNKYT